LPIVAMTAHALASDRAQSRQAGMNDHVVKPIDPDLLFCTLLKWIDPVRLKGRPVPQAIRPARSAPSAMQQVSGRPLPAVPGIDWRMALENVDGQRSRLEKRAGSFIREYASAPRILREALQAGDHPRLQALAHNLKSSAAYVGAFELSSTAARLEQDLRAGQFDRVGVQVPALVNAADTVLSGLAQMAALALPQAGAPEALSLVIARLDGYLRSDDARAEDALAQLESLLGAGKHADPVEQALGAVRRAVAEIEYAAALGPLTALGAQLDPSLEESR
jgi:two-component system sensor histidine kinase/response regulator